MLGGPVAAARAMARSSTPAFLRRASYVPLTGQRLSVAGRALRLDAVADLAGASQEAALRDHPEAFTLTLSGPAGLPAGTHDVHHPQLGAFALFVSPAGRDRSGTQAYEVVVDRSVGVPADPPLPPSTTPPAEHPGSETAAAEARTELTATLERKGARQRRARVRRERRRRTAAARRVRRRKARRPAAARRSGARGQGAHVARRGAVTVLP